MSKKKEDAGRFDGLVPMEIFNQGSDEGYRKAYAEIADRKALAEKAEALKVRQQDDERKSREARLHKLFEVTEEVIRKLDELPDGNRQRAIEIIRRHWGDETRAEPKQQLAWTPPFPSFPFRW